MLYVIYTKEDCSFCVKAKALLKKKGIYAMEMNIDEDFEALEWFVGQGLKTVPQIFTVDDKVRTHIGGFTELEALLQ